MVGCVVREVVSLWVVGGSWGSGDKPIVRNDFLFRGVGVGNKTSE